ncbi:hypothetical protein R3P38DRAFT_3251433 [Favolaschia claudopus]|uniref:Uncharacterized protein n=1 Tax=Favolaschia claudopus TaxID=2862362 RepID=A0AAW0ECH5_9AGAR
MGVNSAQKKAIEEVLDALRSATGSPRKRHLAGMFLELVDKDAWPEYYEVITEPRCLNGVQTSLEKNRYKDPLDAYTDISLVFLNALYYNEPESQIAKDAQTLKDLLESEWQSKPLPIPRGSPPPTSAQKVYEPKKERGKNKPSSSTAVKSTPSAPTPTPVVNAPLPGTSTFVAADPAPVLPLIPAPPEQEASSESEPESEDESEDEVYDPPPGAPTDMQIVKQLERGLPRYTLLFDAEDGWMEDVPHDRHLEIMQAIKAYRDAANVKLSVALEPGIPVEKIAFQFRLLESRSRSNTFYTASRSFDADVARIFEGGRRYHLNRFNSITGVGGDEWLRVVSLQRIANTLTSTNAPPLPLTQPLVLPAPSATPGTHALESVAHKGFELHPQDYVHVISGPDPESETTGFGRPGHPVVGRITACWRNDAGETGITMRWYIRADEISHLMPRSRSIIEGEVVQTDKLTHHLLVDIIERVACQHTSMAGRGRPRAPAWYPCWPLYVCSYRYDAARGKVRRIPRGEWYSGKSGGSNTPMEALDLFERPVRLIAQPKKQTVIVDRSVVSAGGVAVTSMEKLGPETTRHFERDPTTGEMLWFPGPPMHMARPPPPRHRLEYLNFLANKYKPELAPAKPEPSSDSPKPANINGNGAAEDDPMGSDDARGQSVEAVAALPAPQQVEKDVDMADSEPPSKRLRLEDNSRYVTASELIREAFTALARSNAIEVE